VELYIVRHALAESRDATKWPDDRERPLTEEGAARFRKAAKGLAGFATTPDRVVSSPLARAWQTAEILSEEAGWPPPQELRALEPDRTAEDIRTALQSHAGVATVAVVGHEPNLSELASHLLCGSPDGIAIDLKKGSVMSLDTGPFPGPGASTLLWSVPPRALRAL
jgi:phosphohistidine phosphatase